MAFRASGLLLCLTFASLAGKSFNSLPSPPADTCESDSPHQDVCMPDGEQLGTLASTALSSDSHNSSVYAFIQNFSAHCSRSSSSNRSSSSLHGPQISFASSHDAARHSSSRRVVTRTAAAGLPQATEAASDESASASSQAQHDGLESASAPA